MINNVVLIGRLTKAADLKYTQNGTAVASFTLAVNRNFTNKSGEREADFINCVVWQKPAETFVNYTEKGSLVGVVGRLQSRSYDNQQGVRVYVTELVVESFQFLSGTNRSANNQNEQQNTPKTEDQQFMNDLYNVPPMMQDNHSTNFEGDLPF